MATMQTQSLQTHLPDVAIGNAVEHLLALPPRLQEPGGPQKTQVMGDQRLAEPEPGGDLSHALALPFTGFTPLFARRLRRLAWRAA